MAGSMTIVVSIMSPGVAAGADGFVIINGKFHRVPGHTPKLKQIGAAVTLMAQEDTIADKGIRAQLAQLSESLLTASVGGLAEEVGK